MVRKLVNLKQYPIDRPASDTYKSLVARCKRQLIENKLINIENFLSQTGTTELRREIQSRASAAFHSCKTSSPYGIVDINGLPADHPYRIEAETDRYGLGRHDLLGSSLDQLYTWPTLRRFVRDLLEMDSIYLHEDPSNALVAQIYQPGGGLAWHFDNAKFSTILNLSEPEQGGVFEYVPDLRTPRDPHFDDVQAVLLDRSAQVKQFHPQAGSFTILAGRYTMHRVTRVRGSRARISAVLSYEAQPGVRLDLPTRRLFFGPNAPADS